MPLVRSKSGDERLEPKYPVRGRIVLIHYKGKACVAFEDESVQQEIEGQPDCRRLPHVEARAFEQSLPFALPPDLFTRDEGSRRGLGDLVSWLLHLVGIRECSACQQRKHRLNEFMSWGWSRR